MKIDDLKTGMIVETRDKCQMVVLIDTCINGNSYLVDKNGIGFIYLCNYNEDLTYQHLDDIGTNCDIMKVYKVAKVPAMIHNGSWNDMNELIWEREEIKEVTMEDIEEKFGCKVKIVNKEK